MDAVVVLGGDGGMGGRYVRGRDLVLAGYSQRLILLYPSAAQIADARARVPGVEIVGSTPAPGSSGSWGEALAVRERMQAEGLRTVMVMSDPPHMLRLRYTWGSILRGTGLDYTLVATSPALVARLALVAQPGRVRLRGQRGAEAGVLRGAVPVWVGRLGFCFDNLSEIGLFPAWNGHGLL